MSSSVAELEARALELTPEERLQLADRLLSSLVANATVEQAWAIEADRRFLELEQGQVQPVPLEKTLAAARQTVQ